MPAPSRRARRHTVSRQSTQRAKPTTRVTSRGARAGAEPSVASLRQTLREQASPARAAAVARFFKTGKGQYGAGDIFIGVPVPAQRAIATRFRTLSVGQLDELLTSPVHEERLTALLILVDQFNRATAVASRKRIFALYMRRLDYVNNWDLVDSSAEHIVGGWVASQDTRHRLDRLAASPHLWSRRVAMLATFYFIKRGECEDAIRIARSLIDDPHDLIHKAVGWMLREVGKRASEPALNAFLAEHAQHMPRTMLRYAIERLPARERAHWMAAGPRRRMPSRGPSARARAALEDA